MRKFEELDLSLRYSKARIFFRESMVNEEDAFDLNEEIGVPLDSVIIKDDFVRVTFFSKDIKEYVIETKIKIFSSDDKELGWYSYLEDESGDIVDDFLVFI